MSPVACGGSAEVMPAQSSRSSFGSLPEASPPELAPDFLHRPQAGTRTKNPGTRQEESGPTGQSPGPGAYRRARAGGQAALIGYSPQACRMATCTGEGGSAGSKPKRGKSAGWARKRGRGPRTGCAAWTRKG